jgi:hypothetical protein
MWDDYDYHVPTPDQDNWETYRQERMMPVYDLVDLLIKLKVLGPGFDIGLDGHDMTDQFVDRHWKV